MYLDMDKSDKQLMLERLTRRLRDACRSLSGDNMFFVQRSTQTVVHSYRPVVRLRLEGPREEDAVLEYQDEKLAQVGIQKAALAEAFRAAGSASCGAWSL